MGNPEDLSQSSDESDSLAPSAQESGLVELQSPEELNEALGAALLRALNEANSALYGCGSGFAT
ncbi:MAG: hypothetical protein LBJ70_05015 [Holosporales bacterium]|nr:hypothetical protein [Holosporales bacterium]